MFTTESVFKKPQGWKRNNEMLKIRINREEIKEIKEMDERKAIGPDGVSGYICKECRQEMAEPIYDISECFLKTGKVLKE